MPRRGRSPSLKFSIKCRTPAGARGRALLPTPPTSARTATARKSSRWPTICDYLHSAAATARSGVIELEAAKQRVLSAVNDAPMAGFTVGEDYSVAYKHPVRSPAEAAVRRAQAESLAAQIRSRAVALAALDQQVANRISAAAMDVGRVGFKEEPPNADALSVKDAKDVHRIVDPLPPGKNRGVKTLPTPEAIRAP